MGKSQRRKFVEDYHKGTNPRDFVYKGEGAIFYVYGRIVFANNHGHLGEGLIGSIKPIRKCKQYLQYKDIMEYTLNCLNQQDDGAYIYLFNQKQWIHTPFETGEYVAITSYLECMHNIEEVQMSPNLVEEVVQ